MFTIDEDRPIPEPGRGRRGKYPFAKLNIGESFAVSLAQGENARAAAGVWKQRHPGWDYCTRKSAAEYRIWRIA